MARRESRSTGVPSASTVYGANDAFQEESRTSTERWLLKMLATEDITEGPRLQRGAGAREERQR